MDTILLICLFVVLSAGEICDASSGTGPSQLRKAPSACPPVKRTAVDAGVWRRVLAMIAMVRAQPKELPEWEGAKGSFDVESRLRRTHSGTIYDGDVHHRDDVNGVLRLVLEEPLWLAHLFL